MCETHEVGWTVVVSRVTGLQEVKLHEARMHPHTPPYPDDATSAIKGAMTDVRMWSGGAVLDEPEVAQPCGR